MSKELGATLPPPLRFELGAHPRGDPKAVLLLTSDEDGAHRVAVLAAAEIKPLDSNRVVLKVHAGSSACANLRRTRQGALWYVLDAAAYCIRGRFAPVDEHDDEFLGFEMQVDSVLQDFQPDAPLISGPTFRRT